MENQRPILSICLPTNGVVEWVLPTLKSIYSQGVDYSFFEVVITDNGENSKLGDELRKYDYPNLRYIPTTDKGFLNLVTCLQAGTGLFNKMLNHRMMIKPGMLQKMIDVIEAHKDIKPVMYFLNGSLPDLPEYTYCKNLDEFVYDMHYWVSWSAGIGFWDEDRSLLSKIVPNEMFPNVSLLFEHRIKTSYIILNWVYGEMQDDSGKGGYDLFYTFAVVLNDMLRNLRDRNRISERTFQYTKKRLYGFLCNMYYGEVVQSESTTHTYIINDIKKAMSVNYGLFGYYWMVVSLYSHYIVVTPLKAIRNIFMSHH